MEMLKLRGKLWKNTPSGTESNFTTSNDINRVPSKAELVYWAKNSNDIPNKVIQWKNITSTYQTRDFTNDNGKIFKITWIDSNDTYEIVGELKAQDDTSGYTPINWYGVHALGHNTNDSEYSFEFLWTPNVITFTNTDNFFPPFTTAKNKVYRLVGRTNNFTITKFEILEYGLPDSVITESKLTPQVQNRLLPKGNLINDVNLLTAEITHDTNSTQNGNKIDANNSKDFINILDYDKTLFNENPITFSQSSSELEVNLDFKKDLAGGMYELIILLYKSGEYWTDLELIDNRLRAEYRYVTNSKTSPNDVWRQNNSANNKTFIQASGQSCEIIFTFGNNGTEWDFRSPTQSTGFSWSSQGTKQDFRTGKIKTTDGKTL